MVKQAIDSASQIAGETIRSMSEVNPFITFLSIVVVVLLSWFIWDSHTMQEKLLDIKMEDMRTEHERHGLIDAMTARITEVESKAKASEEAILARLTAFRGY